jgi:hypothetical protein
MTVVFREKSKTMVRIKQQIFLPGVFISLLLLHHETHDAVVHLLEGSGLANGEIPDFFVGKLDNITIP